MTILLHIVIALTSLAYASYTFYVPSRKKLQASYALVTLTLASGTWLVVVTEAPLLSACTSGLAYLAVVLSGLLAAQRRLTLQK